MESNKILEQLRAMKKAGTEQGYEQMLHLPLGVLEALIKSYEKLEKDAAVERVQAVLQIVVTQEDIDDIMVSALEGGINYWCSTAKVEGKYLGEYASEQISRGGRIWLYDTEEDKVWPLTKEMLLAGIRKYAEQPKHSDIFEVMDHELHIDCGMVDAEVADSIIQYAIFSDVIYG